MSQLFAQPRKRLCTLQSLPDVDEEADRSGDLDVNAMDCAIATDSV
jgi:hypothetical protein